MLGWLICKVKGKHKRGVKVGLPHSDYQSDDPRFDGFYQTYRCPRCGAEHERKVIRAAS